MKQDFAHKNSQAREERIKELTSEKLPKTVDDVLRIMGDTANYRHPIWRLGKFPDQWATMSLGIQYLFLFQLQNCCNAMLHKLIETRLNV